MTDRENEIISLVTFVHNRIGFRNPPFSIVDFCAAFPNYDLVPCDLPSGFNGEIIAKGAARIIRYRSGSKPATSRFAIGHEIGHGFLHEGMEFQCKVSNGFSIYRPPTGSRKEWEADYFSAELLTPLPILNRLLPDLETLDERAYNRELSRMCGVCGVTRGVMKSRFEDLSQSRKWEGEFL